MKLTSPNSSSKRILQRRRREQQLVLAGQRQLERVGDDVRRLVDVAQPVRFVDDHQVPRHGLNIACLALGELVGADDDFGRPRTGGTGPA